MSSTLKCSRFGAACLAVTLVLSGASTMSAVAQTTPPASTAVVLSEATIKALQGALNKQGIVVKADGVLNDETRAAIRRYQSLHHLPVTGEPDKATLDKLGVVASQGAGAAPAQSAPPAAGQAQMPVGTMMGGPMMGGPMMQGMMQGMMQTMQGMMGMMQGQMPSGQMQPGSTQPPRAQGGMMMNCPMMSENPNQGAAPAMIQMMQGMMQMMQMMQAQMQPGQMQPGQMPPNQK